MPACLACLLLTVLPDGGAREFLVEPPPAWVEALPLEAARPSADGAPLQYLLFETQTRVGATRVETFTRRATRVLSPSGMDDVSQVELEFEPSFEQLTIHAVWIHRGGQRIDALAPEDVKVIQQEKELERRIYNGTRTAVLFLKDVRVGDTVEVASTVSGQNPIFVGHFASRLYVGARSPHRRIFHRLLYPEGRPIFFKTHGTTVAPTATTRDGEREYRWDLRDTAAVDWEDGVPPWVEQFPWVQVTSFADWAEVATWATALFTPEAGADTGATDAQVEAWKKALATPEERLLAATRFVQDDVRYLGIELGANTHQPHAPTQVFTQRFGDCKDKSLLLVTLLRQLGLRADPALVSVGRRRGTADLLPWPWAFDHAIVRAELDGQELWIDGTASLERGKPGLRPNPPFERALLVRPDTTALVEIPAATLTAPTTDVEEKYDVTSSGAATLRVRERYWGAAAQSVRRSISGIARGELQKRFLNDYAREDPGTTVLAPLEIADDTEANALEIRQAYALPGFWHGAPRWLSAHTFDDGLRRPGTTVRKRPLWVEPSHVRHVIEVRTASGLDGVEELEPRTITGPATTLTLNGGVSDGQLRLEFVHRSTAETVAPAALAEHLDALDQMRHLGVALPLPAGFERARPPAEADRLRTRGLVGSALFFGALLGYFVVWPRLKRRPYQR